MYGHTIMRLHFSEQNCLMVNQIQYLFTMFHMIQNITGITEYHSMISSKGNVICAMKKGHFRVNLIIITFEYNVS